ncbi:LysR substrate-binding domain-containing protein [Oceaniglobus trochenteri]|uniref:LysR substrate-binding domain-containing protein n=1 Tax=Oceaniglobus trochenteri TaxID=2763260 RepID=UPI001CFF8836|nr:LysR substrate-binding domain-containing protein [Oceaniglobus trochenteri]
MPTLQQLRYLVALADTRHFRRAAELCHVRQPTLSAQVRDLEQKLGTPLVDRTRGQIMLTGVGRQVAERARAVLREMDEIEALARQGATPLSETIKVGVVQTLGSYLLPLIVPPLRLSHPALKLYVREGLTDTLLRQVQNGALDLLFFPLPIPFDDLDSERLFREPLLLVCPPDHPLARQDRVNRADLRGETVLTLEPGHRLFEQVRDICTEVGAHLSHDFEGTSLDTLRQMVAMGMGLSLLPALYVKSEVKAREGVVARRIRGRPPERTIGMVWRRGTVREPEYRMLAGLIRDILGDAAPEVTLIG